MSFSVVESCLGTPERRKRRGAMRFGAGAFGLVLVGVLCRPAGAVSITVDYTYDTNHFFTSNAPARAALEAAADRYSTILTSSLGAVNLTDNSLDARIGFSHPGTGASYQVSSAAGAGSDAIASVGGGTADEYRGAWSVAADEWILYAGGRSLTSAAEGGTGTGTNFTTVFNSGSSILNRGFRSSGSSSNLPVWGGAITFDNDGSTTWHFDHTTEAVSGVDLYSIALHEIGHALGLTSGTWEEWTDHSSGGVFSGPSAVAAYNADNGASETGLNETSLVDHHWEDGAYDSEIFAFGNPNLLGTVGLGNPQDLLMEPVANFTGSITRLELTNVDVGALEDVGWAVVNPEPSSIGIMLGGVLVVLGRPRQVR